MDQKRAKELLVREQSELPSSTSASANRVVSMCRWMEATGELTGVDQHLGDHATEMFEREKDPVDRPGLTRKLEEIDAALVRIDRGEYGACQVCGREISDERLEAVSVESALGHLIGVGGLGEQMSIRVSSPIRSQCPSGKPV